MGILSEWRGGTFIETVITGVNAEQCASVIAKLNWIDKQPIPSVSVTDTDNDTPRRTVSGFHNRLTTGQHL